MRLRSGIAMFLIVLLLTGLTLAGVAGSHSHEAGEAGLYSKDCSLAFLATLAPSALLARALSVAPLVLAAVAIVPLVVSQRQGASPRLADVRAPPAR